MQSACVMVAAISSFKKLTDVLFSSKCNTRSKLTTIKDLAGTSQLFSCRELVSMYGTTGRPSKHSLGELAEIFVVPPAVLVV